MNKNGFETFEVDETLNIQECKDDKKSNGNVHIVEQQDERD